MNKAGRSEDEEFVETYRANTDQLIGVIHHGDQEIEKHDDVDNREASKHNQTPEPSEFLDSCQLKVVQIYQTKGGPEQSLRCLPQTEEKYFNWLKSWERIENFNFRDLFTLDFRRLQSLKQIVWEFLLGEFSKSKAMIDFYDDFVILLIRHL